MDAHSIKQLHQLPPMKIGLLLLVSSLSIGLLNGCANLGLRASCETPILPPRPDQELCIANDISGGGCFDIRKNPAEYKKPSIMNYTCSNAEDVRAQEEWIKFILKSCGKTE